jgi:hypothetical protein
MPREYVPGSAPALDATPAVQIPGVRGTTNANNAAPTAGNSANIFASNELISVRTRKADERVRCTLNVTRVNADAAGYGGYSITVDNVAVSAASGRGPTGTNNQRTTVIDYVISISSPGVHTIGALVTAVTGTETVFSGSSLVVQAREFTS